MDLMKPSRQRALAGLILWAAACGGDSGTEPTRPPPATGISAAARAYLDEVVGVMQTNSMHRLTIDWTSFRTDVVAAAGAAQSVSQTFPGIRTAAATCGR
jgi:hypothetical protein